MAKCEYCGKDVSFGIKVSHSHRRSNRTWKPNIKRVKAIVNGSPKRVYACTRCLRSGCLMTEEYSLAVAYGADQRAKTFKPQFTVENVNRGFCFAVCFCSFKRFLPSQYLCTASGKENAFCIRMRQPIFTLIPCIFCFKT